MLQLGEGGGAIHGDSVSFLPTIDSREKRRVHFFYVQEVNRGEQAAHISPPTGLIRKHNLEGEWRGASHPALFAGQPVLHGRESGNDQDVSTAYPVCAR